MAMAALNLTRRQAIRQAWEVAALKWKLLDTQLPDYDFIRQVIANPVNRKIVMHIARRWGKSFILCVVALEMCLGAARAQVRYAASTAKSVRNFIKPIITKLVMDCPKELRPDWNSQDGCYKFANGSKLHIAGVNNGHEDDLRGPESDLCIVDEAGFIDRLKYVIDAVLMPQLISTNGILIVASSSPETPAHEFVDYIEQSKQDKMYIAHTIYDAHYTDDKIKSFMKEAGGPNSTFWKREYLNQIIVDESRAVIPEWSSSYVAEVEPDEFTKYNHRYIAMDLGVLRDKTAVLYGQYDFKKATLYVENEFTINGPDLTTEMLQEKIKAMEVETFGGATVHRRVSDNDNPMLIQDLSHLHSLHFAMTDKDSLHAMVNEVRLLVGSGRIKVNPRCTELIGCLTTGIWNKQRKAFDRSEAYGHYDCLAALVYLVRNLDQHTNPIPKDFGTTAATHYIQDSLTEKRTHTELKKLFKVVK